jgi:DNA-binding LacI/PurR family transcriptional regulator
MQDVANTVGVSKQTVSAVINNKPGITRGTRTRVLSAIRDLRYRPDRIARSLATGRTQTIALIVSDVSSPFIARMAVVAEDCAHAFGYRLVVYNTHDDLEREATYFEAAAEGTVDGVLFSSAADVTEGLDIMRSVGIPAVAIDRVPYPYSGPSVMVDNAMAVRLAAEHLLDLGHTRLTYISGPRGLRMTREREAGFREAVECRTVGTQVRVQATHGWDLAAGYEAMQCILAHRPTPTGLVVTGDELAIGATRAIYAAGLRVPEDISIVGMDDIEMAGYVQPPLTTVRLHVVQLATLGVQLLVDILSGKEPAQMEAVLKPELVVRQSTGPPPCV